MNLLLQPGSHRSGGPAIPDGEVVGGYPLREIWENRSPVLYRYASDCPCVELPVSLIPRYLAVLR